MTENGLPEGSIVNQGVNTEPTPEMVPRSHLTQTAHKSFEAGKAKGHESGHAAGYAQALAELNQQHLNTGMQTQGQPAMGMAQPSHQVPSGYVHKDELPQHLENYMRQQNANFMGQKIYNEVEAKKAAARKDIPDYDQVVGTIDFEKPGMPEVYMALNSADNAGHLMYEIAKDPKRLVDLRGLADQPLAAQRYVRDMSESVKQNKLAENTKFPPEPIGQIKSNLTMADSGNVSLQDMKKNPKYIW